MPKKIRSKKRRSDLGMNPHTRQLLTYACLWGITITAAYGFVLFMAVAR